MSSLRGCAAIAGIGQTEFSWNSGRSEARLACEAIRNALEDAGLTARDVDGLVRFTPDSNSDVSIVSAMGFQNLRFMCDIGFGGSAHVGFAAMAIALGQARVVVCFRALNKRSGRSTAPPVTRYGGIDQFMAPFGLLSSAPKFALYARRHMLTYGTTSQQFGQVAVTMREHAQRNPRALLYGRPITLEDHQASPMVADPLRKLDCCLDSDGAVAVVVTSAEQARNLSQRPVYIEAFSESSWSNPDGIVFQPDLARSEAEFCARDIYAAAGVGPGDIDVAGFYDHFSPFVIFALEAYGFCKPGEGGPFVAEGRIQWPHGDIPVNTHGGNLAEGYVHGMGHIVEAVRQLRGTSTCQVVEAELALVGSAATQRSSAVILRR